jgi:two-component system nitrate/nitrite response regulator NarL
MEPNVPIHVLVLGTDSDALRHLVEPTSAPAGVSIVAAVQFEEAVRAVRTTPPDVVLVDTLHTQLEPVVIVRVLRALRPQLPVILMADEEPDDDVLQAIADAGCAGIVSGRDRAVVGAAVMDAHAGESVFSPALVRRLATRYREVGPVTHSLTYRELEVLVLLAQGRATGAIATELGITSTTVRGYVQSLLAKLGVHSRLEAVVVATRLGLLTHR